MPGFFNQNVQRLNSDQDAAFQFNKTKIDSKDSGLIFIDSPGGTEKTFLLNTVLA